MKIIQDSISLQELKQLAQGRFGNMVKAVVDLGRSILALDAELHSDLETLLMESGSKQSDLWGINIYPDLPKDTWVEYDSMINLRPSQGNRSRGVEDPLLREKISEIVVRTVKQ